MLRLQVFLFCAVSTIAAFCAAARFLELLSKRWSAYASLPELGRLIFCAHVLYALVLTEQLVPYSIFTLHILYGAFLTELNAHYKPCVLHSKAHCSPNCSTDRVWHMQGVRVCAAEGRHVSSCLVSSTCLSPASADDGS